MLLSDVSRISGVEQHSLANYIVRNGLPFDVPSTTRGAKRHFDVDTGFAFCLFAHVASAIGPGAATAAFKTWMGSPWVDFRAGAASGTVLLTNVMALKPADVDLMRVRRLLGWIDRPIDVAIREAKARCASGAEA